MPWRRETMLAEDAHHAAARSTTRPSPPRIRTCACRRICRRSARARPPHRRRRRQGGRRDGRRRRARTIASSARSTASTGFTTAPHGTPEALPGERPTVIGIVAARHPTPDARASRPPSERWSWSRRRTGRSGAGAAVGRRLGAVGGAGGRHRPRRKTALTRGLLKCGADIDEMNTVRRHMSRIKGGRLRRPRRRAC